MSPAHKPAQSQSMPGSDQQMEPKPDYGYDTYEGHGRLEGRKAVVTGADSGIGKAVALAFAREGADVLISYLEEHEDAEETKRWVEEAGRQAVLCPGDISELEGCERVVQQAVDAFGRIDVLVNNAAFQIARESLEEVPDEELVRTYHTNVLSFFRITKAALPHMGEGSSIINTGSVQGDQPSPALAVYASTKAAIANMTGSLAQMLGPKGIRVNAVAPGPVWTPLIPGSMPAEQAEDFGSSTPLGRAAQPGEYGPIYVLLASEEGSAMAGSVVPATMGMAIL